MTLVHVAGMSGIGKTFLCQQLGDRCHDLDDIVRTEGVDKYKAAVNKLVADHARTGRPLVLVGSFALPVAAKRALDHRIVLTIGEKDEQAAYRRFMLRNLKNIVDRQDEIRDILEKSPVRKVQYEIGNRLAINTALWYEFDQYIKHVRSSVDDMVKHGYTPMTQAAALTFSLSAVSPRGPQSRVAQRKAKA